MDTLTPMLQQYQSIKAKHQNCILFFRLGDFYEMFYEDAKEAAGILGLVLTSRGAGRNGRVPMCGIPYHAADSYIARLIKAGLKVAICEQVEDPALAKGIVKRDVIRTITCGTFIDENSNDSRYLLSLSLNKGLIGVAFTDTASGTIRVNQYPDNHKVIEVISKLPVYECIFPAAEEERIRGFFRYPLLRIKSVVLTPYQDWCFNPDIAGKSLCEHLGVHTLKGFGVEEMPQATASAGALLEYLKQMHKQPLRHIAKISLYSDDDYAFISPAAVYGLELERLIETIDRTQTSMGRRAFKYCFYHPLKNPGKILQRQQAVALLRESSHARDELGVLLRNITDIEKSLSRISCGYSRARDFLALRCALARLPQIQKLTARLEEVNPLFSINDVPQIRELLEKAINPDVSLSHPEGKIIRKGFNQELDSLRDIQENGRNWLKNLQAEEIKRTGINSLKIGFNNIFGYYIEVTKPNLHLISAEYIRKQTLVNAERFITPRLKEFEEKMLTAQERVLQTESDILGDIQKQILDNSVSLYQFSASIARIDVLYSLSMLALSPGYIAPQVSESDEIVINDGRHPIVEYALTGSFIPNDTLLDCEENHLLIITGPNMAGKSTYIRQVALLVIMAQVGSFIPASSARIGVVDKIFTRIGAHDEITKGQSTFMVEMSETAGMLNNFTPRSLIILDEIGRGTSTFDGLSLAWAIAEYLERHKVRTLFATHFHELTALAEEYKGVKNYNVSVKEWEDEIIFLHKIVPGGTDDSYGIYVAKLAGIPKEVIQRSKNILIQLELYGNLKEKIRNSSSQEEREFQTGFSDKDKDTVMGEIKEQLQSLDIDSLRPLDALNKLHEWKKKVQDEYE
ncbi:MAG: DNA mismatch repair protein MutS [Candidatus Omnitrophota bacterium]